MEGSNAAPGWLIPALARPPPPREQHRPTVTPCLTINEVMTADMSQVPPGHHKASRRHIKAASPPTAVERENSWIPTGKAKGITQEAGSWSTWTQTHHCFRKKKKKKDRQLWNAHGVNRSCVCCGAEVEAPAQEMLLLLQETTDPSTFLPPPTWQH